MTLLQLRLAVEISSARSVSLAAEKLGISQPNASQSIKTLENELGFSIFRRGSGGIFPTEKGYRFLEHAEIILKESDSIRSIGGGVSVPRLHIGTMNYTPVTEAFIRFCSENRDAPKCDFTCVNISPEQGAVLLREKTLDIMVTLQLKKSMSTVEKLAGDYHLVPVKYVQIPICVNIRREHPLVISGVLDGSAKGFAQLAKYPYAEYRHLEHMTPSAGLESGTVFAYSYKIYADERETRLQLVGETNAYSIGCRLSASRRERFGLVCIPIGSEEATLVTLVRKGDEERQEIRRFTELILEEIAK